MVRTNQGAGCWCRYRRAHTWQHTQRRKHSQETSNLPTVEEDGERRPAKVSERRYDNREEKRSWLEIDWDFYKRTWKNLMKGAKLTWGNVDDVRDSRMFGRLYQSHRIVYCFRRSDDISFWYVNTDQDIQGYSWAELVPSDNEKTCMFRGRTSNRLPRYMLPTSDPLEARPLFHGYCYMETKPFTCQTILDKVEYMDLSDFNAIKLRLRGDGRMYKLGMLCDYGMLDYRMFWAPIFTKGGPEWQEITIPYCKFYETVQGQKTKRQHKMKLDKLMNFQFNLRDGIEGPFQLEIDYIALARIDNYEERANDYHNPWLLTDKHSG